ncbi:murein transglycosylase A [Formosimonas limnophila]|nr:MltA domain-containing protein [Formosimonas limnophila]
MHSKALFPPKLIKSTAVVIVSCLLISCTTDDKTSKSSPQPNAAPSKTTANTARPANYAPLPVTHLPAWPEQNATLSLSAFLKSCNSSMPKKWETVCQQAKQVNATDATSARQFFEQHFTAWQLNENGKTTGLITGYYEPVIKGSLTRTATARFPIYGIPTDLIVLPIDETAKQQATLTVRRVNGTWQVIPHPDDKTQTDATLTTSDFTIDSRTKVLKTRLNGQQLVPYLTREQIDAEPLKAAPILGWADDEVDLFFLEIQGSGRLKLTDGSTVRLSYAEQNGHRYKAIGKWLADYNYVKLHEVSAQIIKDWLAKHPKQRREVLNQNPSYVFFQILPSSNDGPIGAQGVPLTAEHSIAVDPRYTAYGTPTYLSTTHPHSKQPLNRLMIAQDTGGAIRGAVRADIYWGSGQTAGELAGHTKQVGQMWLLLPNGEIPFINN